MSETVTSALVWTHSQAEFPPIRQPVSSDATAGDVRTVAMSCW